MTKKILSCSVLSLLWIASVFAAPIRVSFLDTNTVRENTFQILANTGCDPANLDALETAILHYYKTPLALDTSSFPPNTDGFYEFPSAEGFVSALGTNQLPYLDHDFELNCFDTAMLLCEPTMRLTANLQSHNHGPFLAVQVTTNYHEWLVPVVSLSDVYATAYPDWYGSFMANRFGIDFTEKHKTLVASLYQYQTLPLGTTADSISEETEVALCRHWKRCGIQFPSILSLVMLHRASTNYHLVVTDHMGTLLQRDNGYMYIEKAGGRGPFLRIDVQDPADITTYFSSVTWPDYPFNFMSINDDIFLDIPLNPRTKPSMRDLP